jgi:hypothetical protein
MFDDDKSSVLTIKKGLCMFTCEIRKNMQLKNVTTYREQDFVEIREHVGDKCVANSVDHLPEELEFSDWLLSRDLLLSASSLNEIWTERLRPFQNAEQFSSGPLPIDVE